MHTYVSLKLLIKSVLTGIHIQAKPSVLILDSSSGESHLYLADPNGILLLLISHCAEIFCHLQPLPLLSVSTVNESVV